LAFHFIVQFGYFSFGGSTVICVFEKVKYVWLLNLQFIISICFLFPLFILEKNQHSVFGDIWHISYGTQFFIARAIIVVYHEYANGARKMCAEVLLVHIYKS
jgi:hypothetical protein